MSGHMSAPDRAASATRIPLRGGGRSLIAPPASIPPFKSPARVMVLFAVSVGCRNIWSGPEDRHCKVHNGLTLITRPPARRAIACTLALGRSCVGVSDESMTYAAALACGAQRNGSPDRQTLCRMTDSLRAKATRALPEPERRSIASAQSFRCSGRFTR